METSRPIFGSDCSTSPESVVPTAALVVTSSAPEDAVTSIVVFVEPTCSTAFTATAVPISTGSASILNVENPSFTTVTAYVPDFTPTNTYRPAPFVFVV